MIEQDGDYFDLNPNTGDIKVCIVINKGRFKDYPTINYFEIPGDTQSMITCKIFIKYFLEF